MPNVGICVGINAYSNKSISSLKVCENDASAIAALLEEDPFNYEKVLLLSTEHGKDYPSKNNVIHFLKDIVDSSLTEDLLFFYFSGHGFRIHDDQYLMPADAHPQSSESFIHINEIKEILKNAKAKRKLIIIDACKSGEDTSGLKKFDLQIDPETIGNYFSEVAGTYVLFSSGKDEVSWEDTDGQHSVFTKFLLKALRGESAALRSSNLTIESLFEYLSHAVPRYSRKACPSMMNPVSYSVTTKPLTLANFKHIKMSYSRSIYDVFVPVGTPTLTYVQRDEFESDLLNTINRPGKQIYLYGSSGSGKTCLYEKLLSDNDYKYIMFPCKATYPDALALSLNIYFKFAREVPKFHPKASYDVKIAQLTSQTIDKMAEDLRENNIILILDDFHRLAKNVVSEFADIVKTFILAGAKIIFVGVSNTADLLVSTYPDLNDRIDGIEIRRLEIEELRKIIQLGEEALNFKFSDSITQGILRHSLGSASLVHDLCLTVLEENGFKKKSRTRVYINDRKLLSSAFRKVSLKKSKIYSTIYQALSYGRRKAKKFQTYRMFMESLATLSPTIMSAHKDKLYDILSAKFGADAVPRYNYTQALTQIPMIQQNLKEVISYNRVTEIVEIIDPGFKFYLNWVKRPELGIKKAYR